MRLSYKLMGEFLAGVMNAISLLPFAILICLVPVVEIPPQYSDGCRRKMGFSPIAGKVDTHYSLFSPQKRLQPDSSAPLCATLDEGGTG